MKYYLIQLLAAYFVGISCSISVEEPRKMILKTAIIDMAGWGLYLFCLDFFHWSIILSTYIAGLLIASLSHGFARLFKEPVTVFFIPGFFTLVPGGGMYRTAFYLFQGNTPRGLSELSTTLFIALAIALAVFTCDTTVQIIFNQKMPKFIQRNRKHKNS